MGQWQEIGYYSLIQKNLDKIKTMLFYGPAKWWMEGSLDELRNKPFIGEPW